MKKIVLLFICCICVLHSVAAQKKVVLLDVSHEQSSEYTKVNPRIFDQYQDLVENKLGATLLVNYDKDVDEALLAKSDVLIILSPLSKTTLKKNLTPVERESIVDFVSKGGKLIFFADEDKRMDVEAFGGNDLIKPFGMAIGNDLPYKRDVTAISFIGEVFKGKYEVPYSGSRELTGGIPISVMNAEGGHAHGAYVQLDNGGCIVAFGETMAGLFLGDVEMKMPNGGSIKWRGKDNQQFMFELIGWMLD